MKKMSNYNKYKMLAREEAIDWQVNMSQKSMSYGELAYYQKHFALLGKRYGLTKEFRENGII